jgi:predicted TIM-barrel fold metal-dependent hydrolase
MSSYGIISADSHFVEPPKMWGERLDKKFRDRAPHTVRGLNGKDGEFFVCQNINPFPVAAFFGAGVPSEQLPEHNKKGMEAAPASVWDPAARLKDQDRDGIVAEVIYTSMGMPLYMLDDAELRTACFRAYNDWAVEYCSHNPKRLLPLGLLTLEDIGAAVQELERIAKKGIRGAMIWAEAPADKPYNLPDYDPIWAAAQERDFPLSLHVLTGRKGTGVDFFSGNLALQGSTLHHEVERSLAVFILGGVLERFPKLTIISAENDVAWMPYLMWRMDMIHSRLGALAGVKLAMKPSDYIKRQVYATFINEPVFIKTLDIYGPGNAMWSSDYPHTAATWPRSQDFINKTFNDLSDNDRRLIVHDTAAKVYRIEV